MEVNNKGFFKRAVECMLQNDLAFKLMFEKYTQVTISTRKEM